MKQRYFDVAAIVALFLIACAFYSPYLFDKPGFSGDSIKFQAIGPFMGAPHPTGYPLYMGLLWIASNVPASTYAFKANILSLLFSLASLFSLYAMVRHLGNSAWIAFGLCAFFAATPTVWNYSCVAEVYSLHWLLLIFFLRATYNWLNQPTSKRFMLVFLLLTLSFLHHLLTITLLPGSLILLLFQYKKLPSFKIIGLTLSGCAVIFVCVHAAFYFRLQMNPPYLDGEQMTAAGYINYIMGGGYRTLLLADETVFTWLHKCGLLLLKLTNEWTVAGCVVAAIAVFANIGPAIKQKQFELFILVHLFTWLAICGPYDIPDIEQYYPHALILILLLIALRLPHFSSINTKYAQPVFALLILCFVGYQYAKPPTELVKYRASLPQPLKELLLETPHDAILDAGFYTYEQLLNYYRMEQDRFDVKPFILPEFAAQTFNYLAYGVPLNARGEAIQPGRRAFTFVDKAAYQRIGMRVETIIPPDDSPLNETFVQRLQRIAKGKSVFIAGAPSLVAGNRSEWAQAFQTLGIDISENQMNQQCVVAYHPNFGDEDAPFIVESDAEQIVIQAAKHNAVLFSEKSEQGYLSYVEIQGVKFGDYQSGYTFVIVDGRGAEQAFSVEPMYSLRVFPFRLVEVFAPGK
ncbi:DUF2723 domain-containing protein [bacterium]|nr:DUF2723 domain-containing protein [bacterium]